MRHIQRGLAVCCVLVLSGCASPQLRQVPQCERPAIDTSHWQAIDLGAFRTRLPREFQPEALPRCYHGGTLWSDGTRRFGYCHGHFGQPQPTGRPSECRMTFLGQPTLVSQALVEGKLVLSAIHVTANPTYVVTAESPNRKDLELFLTALWHASR